MNPFKVVCIDGVNRGAQGVTVNSFTNDHKEFRAGTVQEIYEGETYTVIGEDMLGSEKYYFLYECPSDTMYKAKRFIPLSNIDEADRIAEHQHEAIIYQR